MKALVPAEPWQRPPLVLHSPAPCRRRHESYWQRHQVQSGAPLIGALAWQLHRSMRADGRCPSHDRRCCRCCCCGLWPAMTPRKPCHGPWRRDAACQRRPRRRQRPLTTSGASPRPLPRRPCQPLQLMCPHALPRLQRFSTALLAARWARSTTGELELQELRLQAVLPRPRARPPRHPRPHQARRRGA